MAVTLARLCENANKLYGMHVLAGNRGMRNIVQWVHTLEDEEVSTFLHGGELVFTTGIGHRDNTWLLSFTKNLYHAEASGLVVNYGPYIDKVPKEVIEYCNDVSFPLLVVPWKTRLVDITRDFCNQIIKHEKVEETVGDTLQKLIRYPGEGEHYIPLLERQNFKRKSNYCVIAVALKSDDSNYRNYMCFQMERIIVRTGGVFGFFMQEENIFYVLAGFEDTLIDQIAEEMTALNYGREEEHKIYLGVGPNETDIQNLPQNYRRAFTVLRLGKKLKQEVYYYQKLGLQKVLIAVDDSSVLQNYYNEAVGKLEEYDKENHAEYVRLLQLYLEHDGSIQQVAEILYLHRNTVNYQLNKIKKIIGNNLNTLDERFRLMLAFQIKELL